MVSVGFNASFDVILQKVPVKFSNLFELLLNWLSF